ncbi:ATP-binding cassette domain-containing protein [Streptomyces radicis]|uniref:ABC transporter ATP-binding protein n=1 Tax=Streptomyces radicis TaxID=1750517 RepID=A0A3A9W3I5_9ACTN|nr:ABC transporter ATP-binding protein [Streptomyces radicis]RKN07410.1 ABC transporter ATP-binding protein [Streptomyces radicis]RKN19571.1 ABC transporter ATP-binding protein [Streptomyces radicis]
MTWHLFRLLAGRPRPHLLLDALWTLLRVTILLTGLLLQAVFDHLATGSQDRGPIVLWAALLAVNEAARLVLWYGVVLSRVEPTYTYTVRSGLQDRVVGAVLRRPAATALRHPVGDVVSRLGGDADEVGVFAIWSASNVARLAIAGVAIAVMARVDAVATAGLVAVIAVVTVLGRLLNGPVGRRREASRAAAGEVSTVVGEAVGGFLALKAARAEGRMTERLRVASDRRRAAAVRDEALASAQESLFRVTTALGTGLVLLLVAGRMREGAFSVGDLALFVFYTQFIGEAVNALGMLLGRIRQAGVSLGRLGELAEGPGEVAVAALVHLDHAAPPAPGPPRREPLRSLSVSALTCLHPGTDRGVRGVDLSVRPGTLTVVTGPVGAGKTTLLRALLGVLPAGGEIRWNGEVVADPGAFMVPPRVAYLPQVPALFSGTLRENVRLGVECDDAEVLRVLELATLGPDLAAMPQGLDTVVGPRGARLSGGQARRVALARALLRDPELLVLDDVSNALDLDTERALWANLLATARTVLAVTHRAEVIAAADRVVRLEAGRVHGVVAPRRPNELSGPA